MILAVDVYYGDNTAVSAGVLFNHWSDCKPTDELVAEISNLEPYIPGEFYRRELPCILAILKQLQKLPEYVIIDGYVYLGKNKKPGLGKHLYDVLQEDTAVIGVAKTYFQDTPLEATLYRGKSKRPVYVTAVGLTNELAKQFILEMCGENRIPILLKTVDQICRRRSIS